MLDGIPSRMSERTVFRLSRISADDGRFLAELDLDAEGREELLDLLSGKVPADSGEEFLDGPFRSGRRKRNQTRFSDGSFPVFYSALRMETATAEVAFWFRKSYAGNPKENRKAYYQGIRSRSGGWKRTCVPRLPTGQIRCMTAIIHSATSWAWKPRTEVWTGWSFRLPGTTGRTCRYSFGRL